MKGALSDIRCVGISSMSRQWKNIVLAAAVMVLLFAGGSRSAVGVQDSQVLTKLDPALERQMMIGGSRALREKLLRDRYRPGYHFVAMEGRASPFDVNGAIFWKGRYHLFYIF
ncbi:MAG: hypothetical protein ACYST6_18085, partial [Planctomycetota bacterium]